MSRRKILVVTAEYPPLVGGIASVVSVLSDALRARDDVELVLAAPEGTTDPGLAVALTRPRGALATLPVQARNAAALRRLVRARGIEDALFMDSSARAHGLMDIGVRRSTVYVYGTEILVMSRSGELLSQRIALQLRAMRRASRVVAISEATRELIDRVAPGLNPAVLYPPCDPARVYDPARHAESPYDAPPGTLKLLTVSRLVPRKGHELVLELLSRLRDRLPPWRWTIVGSGPVRERLEARARELGLAERVVFAGSVPDAALGAYYHFADLFIMLSIPAEDGVEGFGLTYVEAGLSGTASVASMHGGAREAVQDGETGLVVSTDDLEAAGERFLALALDPERRARYAAAHKAWAEANLSPQHFADALLLLHDGGARGG